MAGPSFYQRHVPKFSSSSHGGAGVRRMIFTNKTSSTLFNKNVVGAGVGGKSISNRQALLRRANNNANGDPICRCRGTPQ